MTVLLIVILLLVGVFVAASVAFARSTYEVQSARDTEYLELEGHWIRYRVTGGGPPVVLVHGWLCSGRIWERLAGRLAQRFTVYSLDLSGFGESDKPITGYGVRYGSRLLYAFCAHFGLTRAAVVGHDLGGAMAVKLAADHPDVVGRLVLVATPADEDQIDLPTLLWFATLPVVGPLVYTLGKYAPFLRRLWMRPFVSDPGDLTEEAIDDSGRSTPAAASSSLHVMQREISRGRLVRQGGIIKVPVLLIAGEEDQIVDPDATGDWERSFPSAEVVLMDAVGHLPMLENPGDFDARVLAFLTGDPRYLEMPIETDEDLFEEPEEPAGPPPVIRKQRDRPPPRRPVTEDEDATAEFGEAMPPLEPEPDVPDVPDEAPAGSERPAAQPERSRRDRVRREGDMTLPEDLFQWPETWKEFRPREPFDPGPDDAGEDPGREHESSRERDTEPGLEPETESERSPEDDTRP